MAASTKKTWRVRGIDLRCTDECLQQLSGRVNNSPEFEVHSLATEHHGRSQTATISFAAHITPTKSLRPCPDHRGRRIGQLTLDENFLGFTTLFLPPEEDHQIDVIAISGLGSHAFGSFKERSGEHMWLRDALPNDLIGESSRRPMARVMIFGYDSRVVESESMQNVGDIAGNLRLALTAFVSDDSPRPILVISHSLGGLVVKEAIIALAAAKGDEDSEKLLRAIHSLVFFGVPHLGMKNTSLIPMTNLGPNLELVVSISQANSHFLTVQNREFPHALEVMGGEVFCFYETQMSPTAQKAGGEWKMNGPKAILVSKASATTCVLVADNRVYNCGIDRPHSAIVKYARQDEAYSVVLSKLQSLARRAVRSAGSNGTVRPDMAGLNSLAMRPSSKESRAEPSRPGAEEGAAQIGQRPPNVVQSIPMRENDNFTGRESVLTMLREAFFTKDMNGKRKSTMALVGLGGIGKTQVAIAFSYWVQKHKPDYSIFWVSVLSLDAFNQSCASILRELGEITTSDEQQDAKQQLKDYLSKNARAGKWLLILDNADDVTLLENTPTGRGLCSYFPFHDNGITLITTRTKNAARTMVSSRQIVNLNLMDPAGARTLLEKSLGDERPADYNEETSKDLLGALEMLPLAITQAAAYLTRTGASVQEYLAFLQGRWEEAVKLLSRELNPAEKWPPERQHYAVMTTLLVSLDDMKKRDQARNNSDATIKLLMFLSQVEPKAIPKSMLPEVGGSAEMLSNTVGTLLDYSLLTKREGDVYDMHSLVHLAIRSWVSQEKLVDQAKIEALDHLERMMPCGDFMAHAVWRAYMPHALRVLANNGQVQVEGRFLLAHCVAWCLRLDGRLDDALKWAVASSDGMATIHPLDSEACLRAQYHLAEAYISTDQSAAALSILRDVVAGWQRLRCAPDDKRLLAARVGLARAYTDLRQPRRAMDVCQDILEAVTADHPAYLLARFFLAQAHAKIGQHQKAIKHFEYVAAVQSNTLPQEHHSRLATEHNLAYGYLVTGQVQRASSLLQHVLAMRVRTLPPQHTDLLDAQQHLARARLANGEPAAATSLLEHCIGMWAQAHPLRVFDRVRSQLDLSKAYLALASIDDAIVVLKDVVQSSQALPDQNQWLRLDALTLLQDVFNAVGDNDAAQLDADIELCRALCRASIPPRTDKKSSLADDEDQVRRPSRLLPSDPETPSDQDNPSSTSSSEKERLSKRRRLRRLFYLIIIVVTYSTLHPLAKRCLAVLRIHRVINRNSWLDLGLGFWIMQ